MFAMLGALAGVVVAVAADVAVAQPPVEITDIQRISGTSTDCPDAPEFAHRYVLSNGRSVLLCGPAAERPAEFINAAGIIGIVVSTPPDTVSAAPVVAVMPDADPQPVMPDADRVALPEPPRGMAVPLPVPLLPTPTPIAKAPKPLPVGRCRNAQLCYIQLGAFAETRNVERARDAMERMGFPHTTHLLTLRSGRDLTAVLAGPMTAAQAEESMVKIRASGFPTAVLR